MNKQQIEVLKKKLADKSASLAVRKKAYRDMMDGMLNPKKEQDFDPQTFDPMDGVDDYEVKKRNRVEPPRTLPTKGMRPKQLMDGQMIGMYESKQDLYLLIAWLSERVTTLEDKLVEHGII